MGPSSVPIALGLQSQSPQSQRLVLPCRTEVAQWGGHLGLLTLVSRTQGPGSPQDGGAGVSELLLQPLPAPWGLKQQAGPLGRALRVSLTHSLFTS